MLSPNGCRTSPGLLTRGTCFIGCFREKEGSLLGSSPNKPCNFYMHIYIYLYIYIYHHISTLTGIAYFRQYRHPKDPASHRMGRGAYRQHRPQTTQDTMQGGREIPRI